MAYNIYHQAMHDSKETLIAALIGLCWRMDPVYGWVTVIHWDVLSPDWLFQLVEASGRTVSWKWLSVWFLLTKRQTMLLPKNRTIQHVSFCCLFISMLNLPSPKQIYCTTQGVHKPHRCEVIIFSLYNPQYN